MRTRTLLPAALFLTVLFTPVAEAGWLHQANSVFLATKAKQRQPPRVEQMIVNPYDSLGNSVCVAFAHGARQRKQGNVLTNVRIEDGDGNVEQQFNLTAKVNLGSAMKCKNGVDLAAGSVVYFTHRLRKMPHLRKVNGIRQGSAVSGVISTGGPPDNENGPLALAPPKGEIPRGFVPDNESGWFHSANSVLHSRRKNREIPSTFAQAIEITREMQTKPYVCAAFNSGGVANDEGIVDTTVTISYSDGSVENLEFSGEVENSVVANCELASKRLKKGDLVTFEHTLAEMPGLDRDDYADLIGAVSTAGEPGFRPDAVGPGPGSVFSVADEYAITRLFSQASNQLIRSQNDQPGKWVVATKRTKSNDSNTEGAGDTPAAALQDYENKMGPVGGTPRLLTDSERSEMEWYEAIDTSGGSTALRTNQGGKFKVDLYRPSLGSRSGGPFNSMQEAIAWIRDLLEGGDPEPEPDPSPDPDPDPDPEPGPGNVFSVADEHAITRVFSLGQNQLKRRKNDQPGKWVITTNRTRPDDFRTQGVGSTPSRALDDYERKMGPLGGTARRLTSSQRRSMEWYARMDSSRGPTSVRTDASRRFKVDVYRPSLGVVIGGPFGSIEQAIGWLKDLVGN